jgi:transposase-like protein
MEKRIMSLSRRQFTKEFKEAAVRRLELGASVAEVARACEVNPNVLHRWKRELRGYGAKAFTGNGQWNGYVFFGCALRESAGSAQTGSDRTGGQGSDLIGVNGDVSAGEVTKSRGETDR